MARFVIIFLALLIGVGFARAENRIALVVANDEYQDLSPLNNAGNDGNLIAETLKDAGFEVIEAYNVDRAEFIARLEEFGNRIRTARPGATAAFYFAGHGVQIGGNNFLLPVDSQHSDTWIRSSAINLASVLEEVRSAPSTLSNLVILDACRNDPLGRPAGAPRGLAELVASGLPARTLIAYSTAPGAEADDGHGGSENGPYAEALAAALSAPGFDVLEAFREAANRVGTETGGRQTPWFTSSLEEALVLVPGDNDASLARFRTETENIAWEKVRLSPRPQDIDDFLRSFPGGVHRGSAERRRRELVDAIEREEARSRPIDAGAGVRLRTRRVTGQSVESWSLEVVDVSPSSKVFGRLLPGDIINMIDGRPIDPNLETSQLIANTLAGSRRMTLQISRGAARYEVVLLAR